MIYKIAAIIILLVFSAFFSASETALFSLDSIKMRKLKRIRKGAKNVNYLLRNPLRLLATILIGNTIVNITASAIAGYLAIELLGDKGVGVSIAVMTLLLLFFGEVTPKRYAIERPIRISVFSVKPLILLMKLFMPIHEALSFLTKKFEIERKEPTLTEEELIAIIEQGHKEGVIAGHEKEMIGAVLGFTDTTVAEVMTRREKIKAASIDLKQEEFMNIAGEFKQSRIPVYKNSLDNVMGIVSVKELFLHPEKPFSEVLKPVLSVSKNKKIKELLKTFEEQNIKIAIVLDEKGVTCGLITMEDIVEEVFGEIYDEFEILTQITEDIKAKP